MTINNLHHLLEEGFILFMQKMTIIQFKST